jgi:hypothetical protein
MTLLHSPLPAATTKELITSPLARASQLAAVLRCGSAAPTVGASWSAGPAGGWGRPGRSITPIVTSGPTVFDWSDEISVG